MTLRVPRTDDLQPGLTWREPLRPHTRSQAHDACVRNVPFKSERLNTPPPNCSAPAFLTSGLDAGRFPIKHPGHRRPVGAERASLPHTSTDKPSHRTGDGRPAERQGLLAPRPAVQEAPPLPLPPPPASPRRRRLGDAAVLLAGWLRRGGLRPGPHALPVSSHAERTGECGPVQHSTAWEPRNPPLLPDRRLPKLKESARRRVAGADVRGDRDLAAGQRAPRLLARMTMGKPQKRGETQTQLLPGASSAGLCSSEGDSHVFFLESSAAWELSEL